MDTGTLCAIQHLMINTTVTRKTYLVSFDCGEYQACDGRIVSPGKFEGENDYVPMYWDAFLMGMSDDDDGEILTFTVTSDDRARFPGLAGMDTVKLYEDESGFVREMV